MRIKITVAIAIALAAIGLKALDSAANRRPIAAEPDPGTLLDATWPRAQPRPNSP